jgi:hypothetical protein
MVKVELHFLTYCFRSVHTSVFGGLGSLGCVVSGHVQCPRGVWEFLKYIASRGWPSATVFVKWPAWSLLITLVYK